MVLTQAQSVQVLRHITNDVLALTQASPVRLSLEYCGITDIHILCTLHEAHVNGLEFTPPVAEGQPPQPPRTLVLGHRYTT